MKYGRFVKLKENRTGYDFVSERIHEFWNEFRYISDVIFSVDIMESDGQIMHIKDIALVTDSGTDIEFVHDWWEGQKIIRLNRIAYVSCISLD